MSVYRSLGELREKAGQQAGVSGWLTVSQDMIQQFADATGDHQWIHLDVERAKAESPFGATIAHGFLTMSLLVELMADAVRIDEPCKLSVNYGFNRLRFVSPVPAGSRIRVNAVLNSVRDVENGVELNWGITVEVEGGSKPAIVAEWLSRRYF